MLRFIFFSGNFLRSGRVAGSFQVSFLFFFSGYSTGYRGLRSGTVAGSFQVLCITVRSKEGRALSQRLWAKLADILNGDAPENSVRSAKEWNKFYTDYKCRVKAKARKLALSQRKTGGGGADALPLTALEEQLCACTSSSNIEKTKELLGKLEQAKIETLREQTAVMRERNEIEKEKAKNIGILASAISDLANILATQKKLI
ncbi:hypothetical protein ACJJTC_009726 [Scirpophaga incertulas]